MILFAKIITVSMGAVLIAFAARDVALRFAWGTAQVVDGDTLTISSRLLNLAGIDAPETEQTCGPRKALWNCGELAKKELQMLVGQQALFCLVRSGAEDGHKLGQCYAGFENISEQMIRSGLALRAHHAGSRYLSAEADATANLRGLWRTSFVPPERWRRERGTARDKPD